MEAGNCGVALVKYCVRLRVQYILLGSQIRHIYGLGLREMEYLLIWCTWIRQGLVSKTLPLPIGQKKHKSFSKNGLIFGPLPEKWPPISQDLNPLDFAI